MAPDRGSCYAGRMSLVATLGIHTGGEECAMPSWLHSEWRLLHAYVPACSGSRSEVKAMPGQLCADSQLLR